MDVWHRVVVVHLEAQHGPVDIAHDGLLDVPDRIGTGALGFDDV